MTEWHKVADIDELPEGRVMSVSAGTQSICLTHFEGQYGALDNHCPHQGGPLGEGSIEDCWLRCPWHGYDYHPLTGQPPQGFSDGITTFDVEQRSDGIYVSIEPNAPHTRTVSDVMVETMINWGVTHVFGMVGHSNLGFADAIRRAEAQGRITYVGVRHEGAAAFAATAFGKLTGRLAACFAIAGPGSTNMLTGLYDAKVDRAPVLALSGQVPAKTIGRGAFQDLDLQAAFADVARYSTTVMAGSNHAEITSIACKTALLERDVAHLILPDEIQVQPAAEAEAGSPAGRVGLREIQPPAAAMTQAVDLIKQSKRPVIVVGNGARYQMDSVTKLAEQLNAPVLTTFKAKGLISDSHPLGAGVLGRSGTPVASWFMNESDLMIVFGASFSNHTGIASYKPTIQIDYDPMALGRFHSVDIGVQGHVGTTAEALCALCETELAEISTVDQRPEIATRWQLWRAEKESRVQDQTDEGLSAAAVFAALGRHVDEDAVICVDVGNNTYSFGRYFESSGQDVLMSGYLGSIGFGFSSAIGAWAAAGGAWAAAGGASNNGASAAAGGASTNGASAAAGERQIVSVSGDGGFGQYLAEITTAVKYEMNITHILLNNSSLGKISKEQRAAGHEVWQTDLHNPNFSEYAKLCGAYGIRVTDPAKLDEAMSAALAHNGVALVEVVQDASLI